jgi:hypothetical protein
MRHDWVFDTLRDLLLYARHNNLPALAAEVEKALVTAESELAEADTAGAQPTAARNRPH